MREIFFFKVNIINGYYIPLLRIFVNGDDKLYSKIVGDRKNPNIVDPTKSFDTTIGWIS